MAIFAHMLERRVKQFIEQEKLFSDRDKIIVALSGGADSVALLHLLTGLGYLCEAAHCNFQLRGEESDRDEAFVTQLCLDKNIFLHKTCFDTTTYASTHKISIEMAARELRYDWFEKIRKENGAGFIAVAHHKDDQTETVLLNLLRGTGINGMTGMRPRNGMIVRPLLTVSREDILEYLSTLNYSFVTDSTNLQDEYTRNKLRLNIIPQFEEINPSFKESVSKTSEFLYQALLVYQKGIEDGKKRVYNNHRISIEALLNEPSPEALLYEILFPLGFNSEQIKDVFETLNKQSGKRFRSNKNWEIIKDRSYLFIEEINIQDSPEFKISFTTQSYNNDFIIPKDKEIACFDSDKIHNKLYMRKWEKGDSFVPFGMKGRKLLSDFMTDLKFSVTEKEKQWLLCCGEDIIWVIGQRTDNRFRIDEHTKQVTICKISHS